MKVLGPSKLSGRGGGAGLEILLTGVLILIAFGWFVRDHPVVLDAVEPELAVAAPAEGRAEADILIVMPSTSEAPNLDQLSFDSAWLNTVEQEVGSFRVVDTSQLTRAVMDPSAWVIVPRRAASQLDPTQTQFVRTWVEDGGTVILEQPEGPWRGIIGQSLTGARYRETRRITSFDGSLMRGDLRADVLETPLASTLVPYNPPSWTRGRDYQVLMEVDGQPGVVSIHLGRGHVVLLLFDFGRATTLTQQGRPQADFTLPRPPDSPLPPDLGTVDRLVVDEALLTSAVPYIDLLERNLLYLADAHRPVGRLWMYPSAYRGALLVGHGESGYGARASYMTGWEHSEDVRGTVFSVASSLTPEALARVGRLDGDVALQWVPPQHPRAPMRTWGLRAFRPFRRPMNAAEQLERLKYDLIPYGPVVANRTIDGLWTADWFEAFSMLESLGVALDSTYGPVGGALGAAPQSGYLFGTGLPYRPIDRTGQRFRIRELPVVVNASADGYSVERVRELIVDASEGYHTTIAGDWRPDVMTARPSYDAIEGWRQAFRLAASQELWLATWSDYVDFLARRDGSQVESTFSPEARRLTIELRVVGPTRGEEEAIDLTPAAAFPARFEGRPVEQLIVDGATADPAALALTGDRVLHLLPLEPGEHRIQVVYGSPLDPVQPPAPGSLLPPRDR